MADRTGSKTAVFGRVLASFHPKTLVLGVILRSKATKNLVVTGIADILRR